MIACRRAVTRRCRAFQHRAAGVERRRAPSGGRPPIELNDAICASSSLAVGRVLVPPFLVGELPELRLERLRHGPRRASACLGSRWAMTTSNSSFIQSDSSPSRSLNSTARSRPAAARARSRPVRARGRTSGTPRRRRRRRRNRRAAGSPPRCRRSRGRAGTSRSRTARIPSTGSIAITSACATRMRVSLPGAGREIDDVVASQRSTATATVSAGQPGGRARTPPPVSRTRDSRSG